jgi:chromate transporter
MGVALFAVAFGMLQLLSIHPAIVILVFLVYGAFHMRMADTWKRRREVRKQRRKNENEASGSAQSKGLNSPAAGEKEGATHGMD